MEKTGVLKVNICGNHLTELYEAIKENNINLIDKIEHELTPQEKCVACAYVLKTNGTVKEALQAFLNNREFDKNAVNTDTTAGSRVNFWFLRAIVLFAVIMATFFSAAFLKQMVLGISQPFFLYFNVLEYILLSVVSLTVFLIIDDKFFD